MSIYSRSRFRKQRVSPVGVRPRVSPVGVRPRGFTLIELLLVVALVVIITAVLLVQQSKFNSSTLLRSLAYSVALSVRQAQIYGTTVFGVPIAQSSCTAGIYTAGSCFAPGYGVYFSSGDAALEPAQYRVFGDLNGNGRYDASPVDETIQVMTLGTGYEIISFCGNKPSGTVSDCFPTGRGSGSDNLTSLSIIFKRPNADGCFASDSETNACGSGSLAYASSSITINAGGTDLRNIAITTSGQISVCPVNTAC